MSKDRKFTVELPYPPSVNNYWRKCPRGMFINDQGKRFRVDVQAILLQLGVPKLTGRLRVSVWLQPPDKRRRDIDNTQKSLLDALKHGGAYEDDCQIDELHIQRCPPTEGGCAIVEWTEI